MTLGRKQTATHEQFIEVWRRIREVVSKEHADFLVENAAEEVKRAVAGKGAAFGWSGGKDSMALRVVAEAAGVRDCVFVMTDLEFPEFLGWVTANMPPRLRVINNGWDLDWLAAHQDYLFPRTSEAAAKWYSGVQWWGQSKYIKEERVEVLLVGRRYADGNFIPGNGWSRKKNGEARFAPIRHWTHEEVLGVVSWAGLELPPIYDWPRGFRVGTGPWPARRYAKGEAGGWGEVWTIDRDIVRAAAGALPSARRFMELNGLS